MAKRVRKAAKRAPPRRTRAIPATKLSKLKASKPKTSKLKSRTPKPSKPKSGNSRSRMARLQSELRAAQDRQAASAEILRVIHQSPTDVQPVFEAIVQAAVRLLSCDFAHFLRCHNASFSLVAVAGPQGLLQAIESAAPIPIDPAANFPSRAIVDRKDLYLPDWSAIDLPASERRMQEIRGINSSLFLPLLREEECVGLLALGSKRANNFGESEIALAESFRDQALIAIENVRLFNETKEALAHQTATSEVLRAIGSSMADTQPVFDSILDSVERLFDIRQCSVILAPGDGMLHLVARRGIGTEAVVRLFPAPVAQSRARDVIGTGRQTYVSSAANAAESPLSRRVAEAMGDHSLVMTPMVWEGRSIGMISVARAPNTVFSDKELTLLRTFADQAVIAIQNARLFNETREALER